MVGVKATGGIDEKLKRKKAERNDENLKARLLVLLHKSLILSLQHHPLSFAL